MERPDSRKIDELRAISFVPNIAPNATGSVLVSFGQTRVICAAIVQSGVPRWMKEQKVEGVITTGKSALECSEIVKNFKANLVGFACIINRSNEKLLIKENIISQIKLEIKTYDKNNLPNELKSINPIKPGSRNIPK